MGQKIHPKAFRLGITEGNLSNWYAQKFNYSPLLNIDFKIRQKIEEVFTNFLVLSEVEILRAGSNSNIKNSATIILKALHPRIREVSRIVMTELETQKTKKHLFNVLQKRTFSVTRGDLIKSNKIKYLLGYWFKLKTRTLLRNLSFIFKQNFTLKFNFIENFFEDATLITKFIGSQIKKRVPFRRVLKQTLKKGKLAGLNGIKVELSGRLNGIEIARSEWKREGKIPLHSLNANVQYAYDFVNTVYGIVGIKVWIYKN